MFTLMKARITGFCGEFFITFNRVFVDFITDVFRRGNQFSLSFNSLRQRSLGLVFLSNWFMHFHVSAVLRSFLNKLSKYFWLTFAFTRVTVFLHVLYLLYRSRFLSFGNLEKKLVFVLYSFEDICSDLYGCIDTLYCLQLCIFLRKTWEVSSFSELKSLSKL